MTTVKRMKFADARGARIQWLTASDEWEDYIEEPYWIDADEDDHRIHPDDAHLEYGPISQALIDWTLYGYDTINHPEIDAAEGYFNWRLVIEKLPDPRLVALLGKTTTPDEWGMFRLFMAELLADEGL
jgi:hypothetical protein